MSATILTCFVAAPSTAQGNPDATTEAASPPAGLDPPPLVWRWQRFKAWEYPVTAVALTTATILRFALPPPSADWKGGVLLDDWVQDHTAIHSIPARKAVLTVTDVFFYGSMAYRLVDSAVLPSFLWRSPGVAFQMSMIDLESFSLVAITLWGSQAAFGRERPYVRRCSDPRFAARASGCGPDSVERNRSFFAGHPAVVLTAAGLTCTHHAHLPLYGGGAGDTAACVTMLGAALVTGVGRVITEEHHLSDLVVGYGIGFVAGFLLPQLLHYLPKEERVNDADKTREEPVVRASLAPEIAPRDLRLSLRGAF